MAEAGEQAISEPGEIASSATEREHPEGEEHLSEVVDGATAGPEGGHQGAGAAPRQSGRREPFILQRRHEAGVGKETEETRREGEGERGFGQPLPEGRRGRGHGLGSRLHGGRRPPLAGRRWRPVYRLGTAGPTRAQIQE